MPFLATESSPLPITDVLSWMIDESVYDKDKPLFIDAGRPSRSISCRQARSMVRRLAAGLKQAGLKTGDCVCMHAFNDIHYPIVCLGVVAAGGVHAGTNPAYMISELEHHVRIASIKFWIVEPELLPQVQKVCSKTGIPESNIFAFDVLGQRIQDEIKSWSTLMSHGETDWQHFTDLTTAKSTPFVRLFSSGTTGLPKAMDLSHYNLTSQHTITHEHHPRSYPIRRLVSNPMFLIAQVARVNVSAIRLGIPNYIMRRFDLRTYLVNIAKYQITELNVVPAMIISILQSNLLTPTTLDSVHSVLSGSAPLSLALQLRFKKHLPAHATCNLTWGMSETSCNGMYYYYPEEDLTGAVGRPLLSHDVKLVDDDGTEITEFDTRGELCMRGPSMFMGYFDGASGGRRRDGYDEEGYFHTGDVAMISQRTGLWHIVDRKKSLIKVRGFQVAPAEIEGVLLSHPEVMDVAVVGIQASEESSELPRAYVVRREGSGVDVEDIRAWVGERLARYKQLDGGVVFVESLPKNANSKVVKGVLKERAAKEMGVKI